MFQNDTHGISAKGPLSTTKAQRYVDAQTASVNGKQRESDGRKRSHTEGERKYVNGNAVHRNAGTADVRFRFGQVLLTTKAPLAPSVRAESIGIARPPCPHSSRNEEDSCFSNGSTANSSHDARLIGCAISLDSARSNAQ